MNPRTPQHFMCSKTSGSIHPEISEGKGPGRTSLRLSQLPSPPWTPPDPRPGFALWEEPARLSGETAPGPSQQQPFLESIPG